MIFVDFFVSGAVYFSEPITRIYRAAASRPRGGVAGFLVSLVTEILLSQNNPVLFSVHLRFHCYFVIASCQNAAENSVYYQRNTRPEKPCINTYNLNNRTCNK